MKLLIIALFISTGAHATVYDLNFDSNNSDHYISTPNSENLVIQAAGGLNLFAGSSIQVIAGGNGPLVLATENKLSGDSSADVDIETGLTVDGDGGWINIFTVQPSGSGSRGGVRFSASSIQVESDNGLQLSQTSTKPSCDEGRRGTLYYEDGDESVADSLQVCMKDSNDAYSWHGVP